MQLVNAGKEHFAAIARLVSSPEELYWVHPGGQYPWSAAQLGQLAEARANFTVAVVDGEVAAFANLYNIEPDESAFIGNVIVAEAFRGRGIGGRLIRHMAALCVQAYAAEPRLSVFSANTRALLLYTGLGFEPYAVEARTGLQGEPVALVHMRLPEQRLTQRQAVQAILHYHPVNGRISSSGQPLAGEFSAIAGAGFQAVINLAMPDSPRALADESFRVVSQGMDYCHIPVPFDAPTGEHFQRFSALMQLLQARKVWVHCALNYRASAFLFRYHRDVLQWPEQQARGLLYPHWQPDPVWRQFIQPTGTTL